MKKISAILAVCVLSILTLGARERNNTPSPDGQLEAFTLDGDLWVRSLRDSTLLRLTYDGSDLISNGYASWVYYEEILGRASNYKAFWWSPDSKKIGFYRFDENGVNMFPIYSPFGQNGTLHQTRYPKAGQENPKVRIGIADLGRGVPDVVWADFDENSDQYFGIPFWSDDSQRFYIAREPRRQSELDLYAVSATDGSKSLVYHEEYPASWLDWIDGMVFTKDGFYMARDFESGWQQIYFLNYDGTLKCLTQGQNWDIRLLKADGRRGCLYFTAKRDSRLHNTLYRLDRKGKITALTDPDLHLEYVRLDEELKTFEGQMSTARAPRRTVRGRLDRCEYEYADVPREPDFSAVPKPEIVTIENDGFTLYGLMAKPKDFDPSKKYPVVMTLYGGPGTPYVRDRWNDRDASNGWMFENGIITIVVDPRSSGENGRRGMDQAFGRMTVIELEDYIAWAKWLGSLEYVDASRIGVQGFSFGGTTTSMLVLRYPQYFCCGVAGGGVYDWHLYDSHYTERFMDTPQANPDGYRIASVINYIEEIFGLDYKGHRPAPGALKLTHGTGDDNVHFQNTLQLVDALQKAGYQFELMIYPDGMHGYRGAQHEHDVASDRIFWTKHLLAR